MIFTIDGSSFLKVIDEKIPCTSQNMEAKTCLLMFASLVTLDDFHQLLSTQLTANLTLEWSGGSVFLPLLHNYAKSPFCRVKTISNNALNQCVAVFDRLWANAAPALNTAFSLTNVHAKMVNTLPSDTFNSSAISYNFNLRLAKTSLWSFPGQLLNLGDLNIRHYLCLNDRI